MHSQAEDASGLPAATSRACLPYWLEAAGWAVGLLSDATAAAMGRLHATPRTGRHSTLGEGVRNGGHVARRCIKRSLFCLVEAHALLL